MSRKDSLRIADFLQHILEAVDNIADYTAGMDEAAFKADSKFVGAWLFRGRH